MGFVLYKNQKNQFLEPTYNKKIVTKRKTLITDG